jgi:hypothetical protein
MAAGIIQALDRVAQQKDYPEKMHCPKFISIPLEALGREPRYPPALHQA